MSDFISFENVEKIYRSGEVEIKALGGVSFGIKKGEICVIVGASGAGKTTLLNILGGMDTLTSGRAVIDGADISSFGRKQLASLEKYVPIQNASTSASCSSFTTLCRTSPRERTCS